MSESSKTTQTELKPSREEDPYCLKEYACDLVPADGGDAPIQKTAEPEAYHDNRIYVSNIPFTFSDEDLTKLFSRFGHVKSAMIVCNDRGSKGFGFVTMDSVDSCERARANLHGMRILGRIIEVRKATPLSKPPSLRRSHQPLQQPQSPLSNPSPRRSAQAARMTIPRIKKPVQQMQAAQIAVNPNAMPIGMMSPNLATPCMNPMMAAAAQQSALNLLLNENPVLLQNLLSPYSLAAQMRAQAQQTTFFTPTPIYPGPNPFIQLPGAPLTQPQPGFAYRVATLPHQNFVSENSFLVCGAQQAVYNHDPTQTLFHGHGGSLNNTVMNGTLLSTSMSDHMHRMQDNLVNLLSLNGTANESKLVELQANSKNNSSLFPSDDGNCTAELNDSGRKRRAAAAEMCLEDPDRDGHGSPPKRLLL